MGELRQPFLRRCNARNALRPAVLGRREALIALTAIVLCDEIARLLALAGMPAATCGVLLLLGTMLYGVRLSQSVLWPSTGSAHELWELARASMAASMLVLMLGCALMQLGVPAVVAVLPLQLGWPAYAFAITIRSMLADGPPEIRAAWPTLLTLGVVYVVASVAVGLARHPLGSDLYLALAGLNSALLGAMFAGTAKVTEWSRCSESRQGKSRIACYALLMSTLAALVAASGWLDSPPLFGLAVAGLAVGVMVFMAVLDHQLTPAAAD